MVPAAFGQTIILNSPKRAYRVELGPEPTIIIEEEIDNQTLTGRIGTVQEHGYRRKQKCNSKAEEQSSSMSSAEFLSKMKDLQCCQLILRIFC
jgi:hypothetical protein